MKKREKKKPAYKLRREQREFAEKWRLLTRVIDEYYGVPMYSFQPDTSEITRVSIH